MHSLQGGGLAAGNYLTDLKTGSPQVKGGAVVTIASVRYTVTRSQLLSKPSIAKHQSLWANVPGRLLRITCLEHADGSPSTDNLVITAKRDA